MRLIDADALFEVLGLDQYNNAEGMTSDEEWIADAIMSVPTIEAEPVRRGRWEVVDYEEPRREVERMDDIISRQAAIDMIEKYFDGLPIAVHHDMLAMIHRLPSAQPEIIRCKDCKHWDGVDTCDVIDAPVWDNDFCSMAERRSDE